LDKLLLCKNRQNICFWQIKMGKTFGSLGKGLYLCKKIKKDMDFYDVQITTDMGEELIVQVAANSEAEAEMTAIEMVESGEAGTDGCTVIDCFVV